MSTSNGVLVHVEGVDKIFHRGSEEIHVLSGLNLEVPAGRVPGADGAVRLGQDHAAEPDRRAGPRRPRGSVSDRRRAHRPDVRPATGRLARAARRLRLPVLQPAAGADGRAQRRAAAAADAPLQGRAAQARGDRAGGRRACRIARGTTRARSPAASSSASASPAPSSPTRRCCCATSRPATSTASPATRSSTCSRRSTASTARPSSWSRTIRTPPRARRGRSTWTRASSPRRSRNEVPLPRLEQSEAEEAAHVADAALDLRGLPAVRAAVRDQGGVHRRRQHGRRRPAGRAAQGLAHHDRCR